MFTFFQQVSEAAAIFWLRATVGDVWMYEHSDDLQTKTQSKLASRHPAATAGIIESYQEHKKDR